MKVYVVSANDHIYDYVVVVYASEEEAKAYCARNKHPEVISLSYEEWELGIPET